jgi:hypothetical protein
MSEVLLLKGASQFYSYLDEKNFFAWLESIPAIKGVRGTPQGLELTIDSPMDRDSLSDLVAILTRYDVDRKCLKDLVRPEDAEWFQAPDAYWHNAVFSD